MKHRWTTLLWELWAAQALCAVAALPPGSAFHTCPALALPGLALAAAVPTAWAAWALLAEPPDGLPPEQLTAVLPAAGSILFQVPDTRPDALMIALPFYFGTARLPTGRCTLIFLVKLSQLRQTIWQMTGQERGSGFTLEYEGQTMLSTLTAERTLSGRRKKPG